MSWKTTYPTIADVKTASHITLEEWSLNLPNPTDDVQRSVRRKINERMFQMSAAEVRRVDPALADKWNELDDAFTKVFGGSGIGRM